jgi:hypothetical protein
MVFALGLSSEFLDEAVASERRAHGCEGHAPAIQVGWRYDLLASL